jgi:hypothetical protein
MTTRILIPLLVAGALAFACGPRSHSEAPAALASAQPAKPDHSAPLRTEHVRRREFPAAVAKIDSRLAVNVAPRAVTFALKVSNVGTKHVELSFPNGQSHDIVVVDSAGREVWRWSAHRMFTQGVQNKQLGQGDSMEVAETWTNLRPGKYTAIATLNSTNFPIEERMDFVLP